jgi:hypothetical protein
MDHAKRPRPVDGPYPAGVEVRDLATGIVPDWPGILDETITTSQDMLFALFRQFEPPLVFKSDYSLVLRDRSSHVARRLTVCPISYAAGSTSLQRRLRNCRGHTEDCHSPRPRQSRPLKSGSSMTLSGPSAGPRVHFSKGSAHPTALDAWQFRSPVDRAERQLSHLTV